MRFLLIFVIPLLLFGCLQPEAPPAAQSEDTIAHSDPVITIEETGTPEPDADAPAAEEDDTAEPVDEPEETEPLPEPGPAEPAETSPPEEPVSSLKSKDVTYYALGWEIHGTLYDNAAGEPERAILLLPMLDHTRESYPERFIERLHDELPDALILAIDMRGHGESNNLGSWETFDSFEFRDMKTDVLYGITYLGSAHPTVDDYYVVGASIGSTAAIGAGAQNRDITKIAMLSPGTEYQGVNLERDAEKYQRKLLLVATSEDSYSVSSIGDIDAVSSSQKTTKIYAGSAHGTDMFEASKLDELPLSDLVVDFLK